MMPSLLINNNEKQIIVSFILISMKIKKNMESACPPTSGQISFTSGSSNWPTLDPDMVYIEQALPLVGVGQI